MKPHLKKDVERLTADVARQRAALAFYANQSNYIQRGWQGDPDPPLVLVDRGDIARGALRGNGD